MHLSVATSFFAFSFGYTFATFWEAGCEAEPGDARVLALQIAGRHFDLHSSPPLLTSASSTQAQTHVDTNQPESILTLGIWAAILGIGCILDYAQNCKHLNGQIGPELDTHVSDT